MTRRAQINGIITDKILEITGDACSQRMVLGNPRKSASFQSKLSDYESICKTPVMKVIINEKKVHVELKNWDMNRYLLKCQRNFMNENKNGSHGPTS